MPFRRYRTLTPRSSLYAAATFYLSLLFVASSHSLEEAPEHPGSKVYQQHCAVCHDRPEETRAPSFDTLTQMTAGTITAALTSGKMVAQGNALSITQRSDLVGFLTAETEGDEWIASMRCDKSPARAINYDEVSVRGFGFDLRNQRNLTATQAGFEGTELNQIELAWVMAFPGVTGMRSQPAIVDNMLYLPVAENAKLYAIDIENPESPCVHWVYESGSILRSGAAFGEQKNGRKIIAINDYNAAVHVIDATTGERLWKEQLGQFKLSLGTGTPAIHDGVVYVPVSQNEIMQGAIESYVCCSTHGMVVALDATSGERLWEAHTMEDAKPVRDRGDGQMLWGPSGAPIWNSPVIDDKRGLLYVGTGEATSAPAHKHTDAILAIELKTGKIVWSFQATANDIFLAGCAYRKTLNCEDDTVYLDVDFGASLILAEQANGKDILLGGQKSGTLWALDPDASLKEGKGIVQWQAQFGEGSPGGGIHWGIATDGNQVYAPINRAYPRGTKGPEKPGIHAVTLKDGKRQWTYQTKPNCDGPRANYVINCKNRLGFSGAPTIIGGAVVTGSVDGMLFGFDVKTGATLFEFNTAREFESINGVKARGGSIDNATIVATNGLLLVQSGYALFNQTPGNVLLAFKPSKK
ncbi:outer membrane protein assembly factor BamB family protein [Aurantivibrio plasticivorans]